MLVAASTKYSKNVFAAAALVFLLVLFVFALVGAVLQATQLRRQGSKQYSHRSSSIKPTKQAPVRMTSYSPAVTQPRYSSRDKGVSGERQVAAHLRHLDSSIYAVFDDFFIPFGESDVTQLDHVVLSTNGIFVVETKYYDASIYGEANEDQWTASYSEDGKRSFRNPIRQNDRHCLAIAQHLGLDRSQIQNLVCFVGNVKLQNREALGPNVVLLPELVDTIRSRRKPVFDQGQNESNRDRVRNLLAKEVQSTLKGQHQRRYNWQHTS